MFIFDKAPFPSCHASTLVETAPGKLLAAWFGGTEEKANDVQIWASRFDGSKWGPLEVVGTEPGFPTWNPVLFPGKDDLILWYKAGPDPRTWVGNVRRSKDGGVTWSKPEVMPAGFWGPVRSKPIRLADGTLLAGTSVEAGGGRQEIWTPYVDRSTDDGKTWVRSNPFEVPGGRGQIQPALVELDGKVIAFTRSRGPRNVCRSESADGGKTFTPSEPTNLPNPSTGVDVVKVGSDLILIYNHTPAGRTPLSLARSTDAGKTWTKARDLETEAGEFSYPAMIVSADGKLQITYTWQRKHIKHVTIDPATLK